MKRITSLLLALLLCLTLAPTVALPAAEAASDVTINSTNFPDTTFRSYVSENFDTNGDGKLSTAEIAAATEISLSRYDVSQTAVASLDGIEYLTSLEMLYCANNELVSLDLSKNAALKELYCGGNYLTGLDVSKNVNLTGLSCFWNRLTSLDVSRNTKLDWLAVNGNGLTSIDVSKNTSLRELYCNNNSLTGLDVSSNTMLVHLDCYSNRLTGLNLSSNTELEYLRCYSNQLTGLDLSRNAKLHFLLCYDNSFSSLDISGCPDLVDAYWNGETTELDNGIAYSTYSPYYAEISENHCVCVDKTTQIVAPTPAKPAITTQPKSQSAAADASVKFTVKATGDALSYQWYYRAGSSGTWAKTSLTGNQTATLTVKATAARNGYQYKCKVSNPGGYVYSNVATLTVASKPAITTQPKSRSGAVGDTMKFTAKASGAGLTYQWYYRTSSTGSWMKSTLTGNKTTTLTVPVAAVRNGYQYRCKVTNANGSTNTSAATLTVNTTITGQPADARVALGKTAKFTVKATGAGLTYQWYYKSVGGSWAKSTQTGCNTATLSIPVIASRNGYQYKCLIKDANGNKVYTTAATLKVKTVITGQPTDQSAPENDTAIFTVKASGVGLLYQWQYRTSSTGTWKDSKANGAKTDSLAVTARAQYANFEHRCVITDANGVKTYSNVVKLTVTP